jgi:hypothetical protein
VKVETRITKILASDASDQLKLLKMENLALRCFPSSQYQKMARDACNDLRKRITDKGEVEWRPISGQPTTRG